MRSLPTGAGPLSGGPAPRVLVAFAGRHGATRELAAAVVRELTRAGAHRGSGLSAVLAPVQRRPDAEAFDGVVLGSAVYGGRWLGPALGWVHDMAEELRRRPVWLFSGGAAPSPVDRAVGDGRWVADLIRAREHRFLGGRVDERLLSAAERAAWPMVRSGAVDCRNWDAVRDWSARIAAELVDRSALVTAG